MENESIKGEEQIHSRSYHLDVSLPCPNHFEKYTTKTEPCNGKSYTQKLNTRL